MRRKIGILVNNELESMWKRVVLALFKAVSRYLRKETEKTHEKP
jgi:hypothetical protein